MANIAAASLNTKLKDRTLWYDGDSTVSEKQLVQLVSDGELSDNVFVDEVTEHVRQYNLLVPLEHQIQTKNGVHPFNTEWNIPSAFKHLDVDEFIAGKLLDETNNNPQVSFEVASKRVSSELALYKALNLLGVLRTLIYIINTLQTNNVVWGVGRGSSVSSYVLFLIGVHDVNSIVYQLDITDFLR